MWQLLWLLLPVVAHADMSQCVNESTSDKKNYCMASYAASGTFCDRIRSYDLRTQCMRMVIAKQRQIAYQTPKPPPKENKDEPTTGGH